MSLAMLRRGGATWLLIPALMALEIMLPAGPVLAAAEQRLAGEWRVELGAGDTPAEVWTPGTGGGLRLVTDSRPWGEAGVVEDCRLVNERKVPVVVGRAVFTAGPIPLGGDVAAEQFIYPPGVFQDMRGLVADAEPGRMGSRYIYGCLQATDKLMLPLAMIWDEQAGVAAALACRNDEAVCRIGVIGPGAGRLQAAFGLYRTVPPDGRVYLGRIGLGLRKRSKPGDSWPAALHDFRDACLSGEIVAPPARAPGFVSGLQITSIGPFCPPIAGFDDIRAMLPAIAAGGINALNLGGRVWYCDDSIHPGSGDFLPILRQRRYDTDERSGGDAGLLRLVHEAHRLGMRVFCWGPTLAGVSLRSPEVAGYPGWWIRKADGGLNLWYAGMAPPDASVAGWRQFVIGTVERYIRDFHFDGCWLDSTWKDHALNYASADGWFGAPNGAKLSLVRAIRERAKALNPDFVVMAESGGAETGSLADVSYVRALGVFPLVAPEQMQDSVMAEEACRLPGARPFGQYQVDPGPLGDAHPVRQRMLLRESYKAALFLNNTLPRVPVYFVGEPLAGLLDEPELGSVVRRLIAVRRTHPELSGGTVSFDGITSSAPQVVRYWRVAGWSVSLVVVNCAPGATTTRLALSGPPAAPWRSARAAQDLLSQATVSPPACAADGSVSLEVTLPGFRGAVLQPCAAASPAGAPRR